MIYKGYSAELEVDEFRGLMRARARTDDVATILAEGRTVLELIEAYHRAVDGYLDFMAALGEDPSLPRRVFGISRR